MGAPLSVYKNGEARVPPRGELLGKQAELTASARVRPEGAAVLSVPVAANTRATLALVCVQFAALQLHQPSTDLRHSRSRFGEAGMFAPTFTRTRGSKAMAKVKKASPPLAERETYDRSQKYLAIRGLPSQS